MVISRITRNEKRLKREIDIKNKYAELIYDLAQGYDGYRKVKDLKKLIDDLRYYAVLLIKADDTIPIYINSYDRPQNILLEELRENDDGIYK